jgi:hypothetical protein
MAITVLNRPLSVVPAYNDIEFKASSDQYGVADFKFYVTLEIVSYAATFTFTPKGTNGILNINLYDTIKKYVSNYYPFSGWGFQQVVDGIQDITVNIGEYYSGAVHAGTDFDFTVFNASLTREERAVYLPKDYHVATGRNNVWLNNLDNGDATAGRSSCKSDQDMTFYFLHTGTLQITEVEVITYNSAGTTLGTSVIDNIHKVFPATSGSRYVCVNLGPNGLTYIDPGQVTGTYPIMTPSVASYRLAFRGRTSLVSGSNYFYRFIDIDDCAPKFDKIPLFYLNRFGAYDFYSFYGNHQKTLTANKTYYMGLNTYLEGSSEEVGVGDHIVNSPISISKKTLNTTYEKNQRLSSDWLSDFEIEALQDMITSPIVFTQQNEQHKKYSISDTQYRFKNVGEKLQRLDVNLSEGTTERRQNE